MLNDRDLVVAFKEGDSHAYALIYREYRPVAESICQRILGNPDDAAEAAQETMLRVFQGLPRFNGRYLLRAWVARIATNICLDVLRKRQRRVAEVDSPDAESAEGVDEAIVRTAAEDPSEIAAQHDENRRIRSLLRELPDHHRDALMMREFEGRSHEEIADALGMTAPQVKALIHRAKRGFRRAWEVQAGRASVFTLPALLAVPVRWLRRVFQPAREAAADAVAPVIQLSAQPAVQQATVFAGERVAAAAGALLVAGTIGIGAAALPNTPQFKPKPQEPVVIQEPAAVAVEKQVALRPAAPAAAPAAPKQGAVAPRPRPATDIVVTDPSSDPSPTPEPEPQPEPQPPQAAPAWGMAFRANYSSNDSCDCRIGNTLAQDGGTTGTPGQTIGFDQTVQGAALDAEGDPAWGLSARYLGRAAGSTGDMTVDFSLNVGSDTYTYSARLRLTHLEEFADEWVYTFDGSFSFSGGPSGQAGPVAREGSMRGVLKLWKDGTLYRADLSIG